MSRITKDICADEVQLPAWFGLVGFAPLLVLLWLGANTVPWMMMCAVAMALWLGFKLLTVWDEFREAGWFNPNRLVPYLLWPGMNAHAFLHARCLLKINRQEWCWAIGKMILGATLIWLLARHAPSELLAGWIGLVGAVFLLHFGLFHLSALVLRSRGIPAQPLMQNPLLATSVSEFWGRRWNVAFSELAHRYFFQPCSMCLGAYAGTAVAFLFSGLVHDLVISYPAGAGYGLPTAYFLIQNGGIAIERSRMGKRLKLQRGWRGWAFTFLVTAGPAFWLFHPPFIHRVIVPFMHVIGAL